MAFYHVTKWQDGIYYWLDFALANPIHYVFKPSLSALSRSKQVGSLKEQEPQVDSRVVSCGCTCCNKCAAHLEQRNFLRKHRLANVLKDYIDTGLTHLLCYFAYFLVPVGFPVIDCIVGSKLHALVHLVLVACSRNDCAVIQFGNLDAHHANAGTSTHDKHQLAWLDLGAAN